MDKISKALAKLNAREREVVNEILERIERKDLQELDIKKLKGRKDIFRVRKGDFRIIYQDRKEAGIFVLTIERRSEKTYRFS